MSALKIGRGPKRFRTREERRAIAGGVPSSAVAAEMRRITTPPTEGPVSIFLDDERPCPQGYVLARSPGELAEMIAGVGEDRVAHLALDWYLGVGVVNGEKVAEDIAGRLRSDPRAYPALTVVTLHSSDRSKAIAMLRTIEQAAEGRDPELPELRVMLCDAAETASIKRLVG